VREYNRTAHPRRWALCPSNRAAAYVAHVIVCRMVCRQWRDSLPSPPQGFLFLFCPAIASQGSISLLQWAREMTPPQSWDGKACCHAAVKGGHLELLKWLKDEEEDGWKNSKCLEWAVKRGHFEVLQWLVENGCRWTEKACTQAARNLQRRRTARQHFDVGVAAGKGVSMGCRYVCGRSHRRSP